MLLDKISIYNFRSIKELELKPEPRCQIFVGEIEAGKSNILKAISYLAKDSKPKKKDIREPADGENIEDSYIDYDFKFTDEEHLIIFNHFKELVYSTNEKDLIVKQSDKLNLKELLKKVMGYVRVDFTDETRTVNIFNLPDLEFETNWRVIPTKQPLLLVKDVKQDKEVDISKFKIINLANLEIPDNLVLEKLTMKNFKNIINSFIVELINKKIPNVIFWEYNEKNLLPSKVNLEKFCEDQTICNPLKAMFDL